VNIVEPVPVMSLDYQQTVLDTMKFTGVVQFPLDCFKCGFIYIYIYIPPEDGLAMSKHVVVK
jgi:hypothetical protein